MKPGEEDSAIEEELRFTLTMIVEAAAQSGFVVTIEQEPLKPLEMGNYRTVVSLRKRRPRASETLSQ